MKVLLKRFLFGIFACFFSSTLFAKSCPSMPGYNVTHDVKNIHCYYTSEKKVQLALNIHGPQRKQCHKFVLTDPHFQLTRACRVDIKRNRCRCTVTQSHH